MRHLLGKPDKMLEQWRIQGEGRGGAGPPYQTWGVFLLSPLSISRIHQNAFFRVWNLKLFWGRPLNTPSTPLSNNSALYISKNSTSHFRETMGPPPYQKFLDLPLWRMTSHELRITRMVFTSYLKLKFAILSQGSKNIEHRKRKPDYRPYDEPELDEYGMVSIISALTLCFLLFPVHISYRNTYRKSSNTPPPPLKKRPLWISAPHIGQNLK